jgi:hypothetical protein
VSGGSRVAYLRAAVTRDALCAIGWRLTGDLYGVRWWCPTCVANTLSRGGGIPEDDDADHTTPTGVSSNGVFEDAWEDNGVSHGTSTTSATDDLRRNGVLCCASGQCRGAVTRAHAEGLGWSVSPTDEQVAWCPDHRTTPDTYNPRPSTEALDAINRAGLIERGATNLYLAQCANCGSFSRATAIPGISNLFTTMTNSGWRFNPWGNAWYCPTCQHMCEPTRLSDASYYGAREETTEDPFGSGNIEVPCSRCTAVLCNPPTEYVSDIAHLLATVAYAISYGWRMETFGDTTRWACNACAQEDE